MFVERKPSAYDADCKEALRRAVPVTARRVLDVGCGQGQLGARLKLLDPLRTVFGIERRPDVAAAAAEHLDGVFTLDVQTQDPPVEPGSIDCVVYGDVLEHLVDPEDVLARYRRFLGHGGVVVCSVPNVQHHSRVQALLRGDFQHTAGGLLDATHQRFFTCSTLFKLLLDAGFAPELVDTIAVPCPAPFLAAAEPLLRHLGLDPARTQRCLSVYQYVVRGTPVPYFGREAPGARAGAAAEEATAEPLSFVVCASDEATLQANLLSSPCLGPDSAHEVLVFRDCRSAGEGLSRGVARARHPLVVWVHQDVYLPRGWPARLRQQFRLAEQTFGRVGVAGVYGVTGRPGAVTASGYVADRDRLLREPGELPARVDALDELLLVLPKDSPFGFDPCLGFHFYGADLCLAAREQGLAAVALDALCYHNSPQAGLPAAFFHSARAFTAKWARHLPLATPCVRIDAQGRVQVI
jgi:SAM-dependent methyltransferase